MKEKINEIFRHLEEGTATDEEMKMADQHFREMEQKLSSQIDEWESEKQSSRRRHPKVWLRYAVAVAACLILLFTVTIWQRNKTEQAVVQVTEKDTYNNPEDAAAETERALMKFSVTINKAISYNQSK